MDRCEAGPDFEKNEYVYTESHDLFEPFFALLNIFFLLNISFHVIKKCRFRKWFRSLLVERGGSFSDVFRSKHPER